MHALVGSHALAPPAAGVTVTGAGAHTLVSAVVAGAGVLGATELREQVREAYAAIEETLARDGRHPIRFWNFLPAPGESMGEGVDRYMVFNAGRYDAYARWYGTPRAFSHSLATASAVGVTSNDFVLHCLTAARPGTPVENPRQTPAWRYSTRYGPKPPCFARATIAAIDGVRRLLIGGTASILGEDSLHAGNTEAQVNETLLNIAAVIETARGISDDSMNTSLARVSDVRIYIREQGDASSILSAVRPHCSVHTVIESAISTVCRPELLVEIEAVAIL